MHQSRDGEAMSTSTSSSLAVGGGRGQASVALPSPAFPQAIGVLLSDTSSVLRQSGYVRAFSSEFHIQSAKG
jgi:hypothetical protein